MFYFPLSEPVHSPVLKNFPDVVAQSDIMDILRVSRSQSHLLLAFYLLNDTNKGMLLFLQASWAERFRAAKRADKKDAEIIKELFRKVFMECVYPMCHSASIQPFKIGDAQNEEVRCSVTMFS